VLTLRNASMKRRLVLKKSKCYFRMVPGLLYSGGAVEVDRFEVSAGIYVDPEADTDTDDDFCEEVDEEEEAEDVSKKRDRPKSLLLGSLKPVPATGEAERLKTRKGGSAAAGGDAANQEAPSSQVL
jgi:hypothetical protein